MSYMKYSNKHEMNDLESSRLDALPKVSVEDSFVIPPAYFEKLQYEISNHPFVKTSNQFVIPIGYHEQLTDKVTNHALVSKQNSFLVPHNYFEQLPLIVEKRLGLRSENKYQEIPKGYFEQLPTKIQDRIYREKREGATYWIPRSEAYRFALAAAAITLLIAMLFYAKFFDGANKSKSQVAFNKQSENIIVAVSNDIHQYDENMLIDAIDQPQQIDITNISEQQQMNEGISEFLIDNQITTDDIASEI